MIYRPCNEFCIVKVKWGWKMTLFCGTKKRSNLCLWNPNAKFSCLKAGSTILGVVTIPSLRQTRGDHPYTVSFVPF